MQIYDTFPLGDKIAGLTIRTVPQGTWRYQTRGRYRVGYSNSLKSLNDLRFRDARVTFESCDAAIGVTEKSKYYYIGKYAEEKLEKLRAVAADTMANMI